MRKTAFLRHKTSVPECSRRGSLTAAWGRMSSSPNCTDLSTAAGQVLVQGFPGTTKNDVLGRMALGQLLYRCAKLGGGVEGTCLHVIPNQAIKQMSTEVPGLHSFLVSFLKIS